jgi:hypothetical protein
LNVRLLKTFWVVLAAAMLLGGAARAAEVTRVVSALDDDNRFDFNLTLWWQHQVESGFVKRESQSAYAAETEIIKDLKYARSSDVINLRADFGILWDVGIHIQAPLVLADSSSLSFDQSEGGNCIYPSMNGPRPNCVNQYNSTILGDGILPVSRDPNNPDPFSNITGWGRDAAHGSRQYAPPATGVFQSPSRKGFQNLGIGATWAAFNQARDDTKPTWTLSFDALLDIFKDQRFDPSNVGGNTAVGLGYHQLVWSTWVSKRFRYFDPYFGAWYMLPVRTNGSPFQSYGPTQTSVNPQQQAGVTIGVEQIAWENAPAKQRVTVEARAHMQEYFFGRGFSEIWQPLSGSSQCSAANLGACRAGIDLEYVQGNNTIDAPHPGVTDIDSYATFGGDVGLNVQVGRYVRFHGLFGLSAATPHFITDASPGVDANHDGRVDQTVPAEANPAYRDAIDLPGRRFRVEGTKIWTLFLEGSMMF